MTETPYLADGGPLLALHFVQGLALLDFEVTLRSSILTAR